MAEMDAGKDKGRSHGQVGAIVLAMWTLGIGGMVLALFAADKGQFAGTGLCLLASAVVFGKLLNAYAQK